jgi:hypothetical protein
MTPPPRSTTRRKKVTLCHEGQTIPVSGKAKKGHLKHGDALGDCPPSPPPPPAGVNCAAGQKPCQGGCIPSNQCCADADCAPGAPRCCNGACIRTTECCATSDCTGRKVCQSGSCICPTSSLTCSGQCCVAPAGLPVERISCSETSQCQCEVRLNLVCAPGCIFTELYPVRCDDPQAANRLAAVCDELGC